MSLFLLYGDPHLCDRAPSSCQDSYTDDLFDLLEQINQVAVRRKVTAVVCAGDFFHLKAPSRTSHRLVQRAIRTLQSCPVPYYIVPGTTTSPTTTLARFIRLSRSACCSSPARPSR